MHCCCVETEFSVILYCWYVKFSQTMLAVEFELGSQTAEYLSASFDFSVEIRTRCDIIFKVMLFIDYVLI